MSFTFGGILVFLLVSIGGGILLEIEATEILRIYYALCIVIGAMEWWLCLYEKMAFVFKVNLFANILIWVMGIMLMILITGGISRLIRWLDKKDD